MVTSRSTKHHAKFVGEALIFSGRPNPAWPAPRYTVRKLEEIWRSLEPWAGELPSPPPLGYRGCFLRGAGGREWFAYGGVAVLKIGGRTESRRDQGKKFEKLLLSSAPKGLIPTSLLKSL